MSVSKPSQPLPAQMWHVRSRLAGLFRRRRVPVALQMNAVECGAACLAMILGYYGRPTRVSECYDRMGIGRDGVSARMVAQCARSYELKVKAFSVAPSAFAAVQIPAIVHWNFNHFVVVERWSPTTVEIIDPAVGRMYLRADEFAASFTGVVLTFAPDETFERRRAPRSLAYRYLAFLSQARGLVWNILGASLLLQVFGLALPLFTQVIVDSHHALPIGMQSIISVLGLGIVLLVSVQMLLTYLRSTLLIHLQAQLDTTIMTSFFRHMLDLPLRFFQQRTSGDLLMRLGSNVAIRETLTSQIMSGLLDSIMVVLYLGILLARDLSFGLIILAVGLLQVLLLTTTKRVRDLMQRDLLAQAESQSYLVEALSGVATVKASGAEDRALQHWSQLFQRQLGISIQRGHLASLIDTAMTGLRTISPMLLLWIGIQRVLDGAMSLGTMLALNVLATSFLLPLASLVISIQRLQMVGAHFARLTDIAEAQPEQDRDTVKAAAPLRGNISFDHVTFQYDPHSAPVLHDLTFTIKPGQKVALVGHTGSGKSTLAKLMLGLYSPTSGVISYDTQPLSSLDYRSIRSQCGVVLQESVLFSGSIRENIAFNDPGMTLEDVTAAAQLAGIHDEIARLPMGYETRINEGGSTISGGQRQRIALARALARKPAILVLDEATSHLDVLTEALVDQHISKLSCTRIVIAHRLSTVSNADQILVLDGGHIREQGTHAELLAQNGYYATLVHSQEQIQAAERAVQNEAGIRNA